MSRVTYRVPGNSYETHVVELVECADGDIDLRVNKYTIFRMTSEGRMHLSQHALKEYRPTELPKESWVLSPEVQRAGRKHKE